jgi:hypothetical protein
MRQVPVAVGLLLCEQVIIEEKTRNVTIVNSFTHRALPEFPSDPAPFIVFAILTDGLGEVSLEIVVEELDTLEETYRRSVSFRFANPLQEVRCVFRMVDCSFPSPGQYQIRLMADGEQLAQRKFNIVQRGDET